MRFSNRICTAMATLTLLATVQQASAQLGTRGFFNMSRAVLMGSEQIQKELKMSDEQIEKAVKIVDKMRADQRELFQNRSDRDSMRENMEELSNKTDQAVTALLKDPQKKRLTELYIQVNGARAVTAKDVQKSLAVTEEQAEKITKAIRRMPPRCERPFKDSEK